MLVGAMLVVASPSFAGSAPNLDGLGESGANVGFPSTGNLVASSQTSAFQLPVVASNVKVLILGTGVEKDVFPPSLQSRLIGTGSAIEDSVGYGTLAASAVWQTVPKAEITSRVVGSAYESLGGLESALAYAEANASSFDVVLLAFHPAWLREPATFLLDQNLGPDNAWHMAMDAVLKYPGAHSDGRPFLGIPRDAALREQIFAKTKGKERQAVENFIARAEAWQRILDAIGKIRDKGLAVVAPAGDFLNGTDLLGNLNATDTQMISGVAALPDVITVGSAYYESDGTTLRVSPTSARGPNVGLALKPDVLGITNVTTLVPQDSSLAGAYGSASTSVAWADAGSDPSLAGGPVGSAAKKVMQGTPFVGAAVVAATVAGLSAQGFPNARTSRTSLDAKILRGLLWQQAAAVQASVSAPWPALQKAFAWEQGAGVLPKISAPPSPLPPIPLEPLRVEAPAEGSASADIAFWTGAAAPSSPDLSPRDWLGPDAVGFAKGVNDTMSQTSASASGHTLTLSATAGSYTGGFYVGLADVGASSPQSTFRFALIRDRAVTLTSAYARDAGERTEQLTFLLTPGLPIDVGPAGPAFKHLMRAGLDPFQIPFQSKVTDLQGRAELTTVPPGFWRLHLLADHSIHAVQARGTAADREEELGIRPVGSTIEGFLVAAQPQCDQEATPTGPWDSPACITPSWMQSTYNGVTVGVVCEVAEGDLKIQTLCKNPTMAVPAGIASRQIDEVKHQDLDFCGVAVPTEGISVEEILERANDGLCTVVSPGSANLWTWNEGANHCKAALPEDGTTGDFNVAPTVNNLAVGVASYTMMLPQPNRDAVIGVSFNYRAENAIIFVLITTGSDALTLDGPSGAAVIAADPKLTLTPHLNTSGRNGSAHFESGFISGGARTATITFIAVPTTWVAAPGTLTAAHVELCNIGVRAKTFAKDAWRSYPGAPAVANTLQIPVSGNYGGGVNWLDQTTPGTCRTRHRWDQATKKFIALGQECEEALFAIQLPKNNIVKDACTEPCDDIETQGDPSRFRDVKTPAGTSLTPSPIGAIHDPDLGVWGPTLCDDDDPVLGDACEVSGAINSALQKDGVTVNGRFFANILIPDAAIRAGTGGVWTYMGTDTGSHAVGFAQSGGTRTNRFTVGDFYDGEDGLNESNGDIIAGWITIETGNQLIIELQPPAGGSHTISTDLDCVTIDGTTICS
ncbi:MAG TPA: hypothetical protein VGB52_14790 [Actinomycetota bacterium]